MRKRFFCSLSLSVYSSLFVLTAALGAQGVLAPPPAMARIVYAGRAWHSRLQAKGVGYPWTFTIVHGPAGLSVDGARGVLSWTPTSRQFGSHAVTVQVKGSTGSARVSFTLRVEAPPYRIREIGPAGSNFTFAEGINNKGSIVGFANRTGFVYDGRSYRTIRPPTGFYFLEPRDVNDAGVVCGTMVQARTGKTVGFTWAGGSFSILSTSAYMTAPEGINESKVLNGWYNFGTAQAKLRAFSVFGVAIRPPGITNLANAQIRGFGLNDKFQAVGDYFEHSRFGPKLPRRGWLYDHNKKTYTVLAVPDAGATAAQDIDDAGVVVGWYSDSSQGGFQSYVVRPPYGTADFRPIRIPGAAEVLVKGSNDRGAIVGGYATLSGTKKIWHGFLAEPIPWCQPDLGGASPGGPRLSVCGRPLRAGATADLTLSAAPPHSIAVLLGSKTKGKIAFAGGFLIPGAPFLFALALPTGSAGKITLPGIQGGGNFDLYLQAAAVVPAPLSVKLSNAVRAEFLP